MPSHPMYSMETRDSRLRALHDMRSIMRWSSVMMLLWCITVGVAFWINRGTVASVFSVLLSLIVASAMFLAGMDFDLRKIRVLLWGHVVLVDPHQDKEVQQWLTDNHMLGWHSWAKGVLLFGDHRQAVAVKLAWSAT